MFLPLKDNLPKLNFPVVTAGLIVVNFLIYFLASGDAYSAQNTAIVYGAIPYELTHSGMQCLPDAHNVQMICGTTAQMQATHPGVAFPPAWLTVITSMFLHGGFGHVLGNMLYLFVFGCALENALGRLSFSMFYVVGGFAALLGQTLWDTSSQMPMVGASGAIAAVLAGYLVLFPSAKVLSLFIIFPCRPRAVWVLGSWIVFQLLLAWDTAGANAQGGVAVFAHLGGFAVGGALTYALVDLQERTNFRDQARIVSGLPVTVTLDKLAAAAPPSMAGGYPPPSVAGYPPQQQPMAAYPPPGAHQVAQPAQQFYTGPPTTPSVARPPGS